MDMIYESYSTTIIRDSSINYYSKLHYIVSLYYLWNVHVLLFFKGLKYMHLSMCQDNELKEKF